MTRQLYFEDVWPGDEFVEESQPSTEDVLEFMQLRDERFGGQGRHGAPGRFLDTETARRDGLARPILPGDMSMALLTRLVTDWMGPAGRLRSIDLSFRRPVHHGDRLRMAALVTDANDELGTPVATLDVFFENERGERPVQGTATIQLPRRSAPPRRVD